MEVRRQVFQEKGQGAIDRRRRDDVVIVEYQGKIVRNQRELVHQGGEDGLGGRGLGGAERTDQVAGHPGDHPLQGSDDVGKEAGGVIVRGIQREPAGALASLPEPFGEERGLAETGRRRHQDQACRSSIVQEPGQAGTSHQVGTRGTSIQLRRQETRCPARLCSCCPASVRLAASDMTCSSQAAQSQAGPSFPLSSSRMLSDGARKRTMTVSMFISSSPTKTQVHRFHAYYRAEYHHWIQ